MKQFVFKKIQNALNAYLKLDPETHLRFKNLTGQVVTLELLGLGLTLQLIFDEEKFYLRYEDFLTPNTTIRGTPLSLLRMAITKDNRQSFFADDISITGNLEVGQDVVALFDNLEIDWEEYLSKWVGDVPAHQAGRFLRRVKKFKRHAQKVLLDNVNEYVHEEVALFPPVEALKDFFNEVDEVRMGVDRLEARVNQIKALLS